MKIRFRLCLKFIESNEFTFHYIIFPVLFFASILRKLSAQRPVLFCQTIEFAYHVSRGQFLGCRPCYRNYLLPVHEQGQNITSDPMTGAAPPISFTIQLQSGAARNRGQIVVGFTRGLDFPRRSGVLIVPDHPP